jgi:hypothetical protein
MIGIEPTKKGWQDSRFWYWYWEGEQIEYTSSLMLWVFGLCGRISLSFKPFQIIIRLGILFFLFEFIVEGT